MLQYSHTETFWLVLYVENKMGDKSDYIENSSDIC